jgi:hypothetical protein
VLPNEAVQVSCPSAFTAMAKLPTAYLTLMLLGWSDDLVVVSFSHGLSEVTLCIKYSQSSFNKKYCTRSGIIFLPFQVAVHIVRLCKVVVCGLSAPHVFVLL